MGGPPEGKPEAPDGVRRGRAGTAWPPSGPKGPKPAEGAGGILGAGSGQLSPRRRGVPGRIETQKGPIVFEGGRGGGCREKVRAAASGYPRPRRENPPERSSQKPLGCSIRVRAGQTSGSAGSGAKPPVRPPGQVIPLPRGREAGRRPPGDSAARGEGEAAGATPTGGQGARSLSPSAERGTSTHQRAGGDQFLPIERRVKPCRRAAEEGAESCRRPGQEGGCGPAR